MRYGRLALALIAVAASAVVTRVLLHRAPEDVVEVGAASAATRDSGVEAPLPRLARTPVGFVDHAQPAERVPEADEPAGFGDAIPDEGGRLRVRGTISDAYGRPIGRAWVELRDREDELFATAPCDASGAFDFEVTREKPLFLWAVADEHVPLRREPWIYLSQSDVDCDFELDPVPTTIHGRLFDRRGAPLTREQILVLFPALSPETSWKREPGESVLAAWLGGHVGPAARAFEADVDLDRASFAIEVPSGFAGDVVATHREVVIATRPWRTGDGPIDLALDVETLSLHGSLTVRVSDAGTGAPVDGAFVILDRTADGMGGLIGCVNRAAVVAGVSGDYRFEDLEPGAWHVIVRSDGFAPVRTLVTTRGANDERVVIALERDATVRVVPSLVAGADELLSFSEPMWVGPLPDAGPTSVQCEALSDGSFRMSNVPCGPGTIVMMSNAVAIDLEPGSNEDVAITVAQVVDFELAVTVADPARGLHPRRVDLRMTVCTPEGTAIDAFSGNADLDREGSVRLSGFATPGLHRVRVAWARGKSIERDVVIGPDGRVDAEFDLTGEMR